MSEPVWEQNKQAGEQHGKQLAAVSLRHIFTKPRICSLHRNRGRQVPKQWKNLSADEKIEWLKNEVEDLTKAVERLNDIVDDTRARLTEKRR
jgi:ubiquinone biosynthesis protein UbiJ